jgi:hypothetical protein
LQKAPVKIFLFGIKKIVSVSGVYRRFIPQNKKCMFFFTFKKNAFCDSDKLEISGLGLGA